MPDPQKRVRKPKRDLTSSVICKLCGRKLRILSGLHLRRHGITREEYVDRFGLTPDQLICEDTRKQMGQLEEYFPFRKRELKKAIQEIYLSDGKLNASYCEKNHYSIYHQALWLYKSWDAALKAAGFSPDHVREHERWSAEKVIEQIRARKKRNLALSGTKFCTDHYPLIHAATRYFNSWRSALVKAGVSPADAGLQEEWSVERVLIEIRKIKKSDQNGNVPTILAKAAAKRFGSMRDAVIASGIDPEKFYGKQFWDKEKVVAAITKRKRNKLPLSQIETLKDDHALVSAATCYFKSWGNALRSAGIDPESVAKHKSWTKEKIIAEIRRLVRENQPVHNPEFLRKKAGALLRATHRHFHGWYNAARAAGIPESKLAKRRK